MGNCGGFKKNFFSLSYHTEKVEEDMSEKQLGTIVPLT